MRANKLMVTFGLVLVLSTLGLVRADAPSVRTEEQKRLEQGNQRFMAGKAEHPRIDILRRVETATQGQKPFATILTCSDSRVPPEYIFDQGVGDIFVIRVAGNIAGTSEAATIEYGTEHLGTPLLVVMGHKSCGAVSATVQKAEVHGSLPKLVERIVPAVEAARAKQPNATGTDLLNAAIKANVMQSIADLLHGSDIVRHLVSEAKLTIVGAVYDIETGKVDWLGPHPEQSGLLAGGSPEAHDGHGEHAEPERPKPDGAHDHGGH